LELSEYLEKEGIAFVKQGRNLNFNCPFCEDERQRCGININSNHAHFNAWNCFNCDERGKSIRSFQKALEKLNGEGREKIEIKQSESEHEEADIDQTRALKYYNN